MKSYNIYSFLSGKKKKLRYTLMFDAEPELELKDSTPT